MITRRGFIGTALALLAGVALGRCAAKREAPVYDFGPVQSRDGFECTFRTYWNLQAIRPDQLRLPGL